jgi:VanZ family protein
MTLAARRIHTWLPPLALMAVIFFLSAQPDLSTGLGVWDLILRKCAHATEYALLCLLWWRALRDVAPGGRAIVGALLISVGYAASDEWHQTFVGGRHGSPVDVLIDSAAATAAALFLARRK